ncbi:hypothetical protein V6Z12_D03G028800 [Gossypium hirsutum]
MKEKRSPVVLLLLPGLVPAFINEYGKWRHPLLKKGAKAGVVELCFNGVFEILLGTKTSRQQAKKSITMCSILNAMSQLNLHHDNSQSISLSSKDEDLVEWCDALNFFARLAAYIAILAVMVFVVLIILKYITELHNESDNVEVTRSVTVSETDRLWPEKTEPMTIYDEENKVCPVCRRIIGKVRKLFAP